MERIPIIEVDDILIASIQVDLNDKVTEQLQQDILDKVAQLKSSGVLIDLSVIDIVDSYILRLLSDTALMVRTLGAEMVVCGISSDLAVALTELGLELPGVETALDSRMGLEILRERKSARRRRYERNKTR